MFKAEMRKRKKKRKLVNKFVTEKKSFFFLFFLDNLKFRHENHFTDFSSIKATFRVVNEFKYTFGA